METNTSYNSLYLSLINFYVGYTGLNLKDFYEKGYVSKSKYYKILKNEFNVTRADYLVLFTKLLYESKLKNAEVFYENLNTYFKV